MSEPGLSKTDNDSLVLPAGFRWVSTPGALTEANADDGIPILRPDDQIRAARWRDVLHGYSPVPAPLPARAADPNRWLIGLDKVSSIGTTAARMLGRHYYGVAHLPDAAVASVPDGASVMLAAPAAACKAAALQPLLAHWGRRSIRVGLLTGHDEAGMTFFLSKILAHDLVGTLTGSDVYLDGTTGSATIGADSPIALSEAIDAPWRSAILDAHGSGAHAIVGTYSVCGLVGEHELDVDGVRLPNGCTPGDCRFAGGILQTTGLRDLRCRFLGLFVCNGITLVVGEQYPTDVALALAAVEGHPAAVLGLLRQDAETSSLEPTAAMRLLAGGTPYGTVAMWLADDAAVRGAEAAYVLLGDPDQSHVRLSTEPALPVAWPKRVRPEILEVTDSRGATVPAVISRQGLVLPTDVVVDIHDASAAAVSAATEAIGWLNDLDEAAYLEDNLRGLAYEGTKQKQVVHEALEEMRGHRSQARVLALDTLRRIEACRRQGRGRPGSFPRVELAERAQQWAHALARITTQTRSGTFARLWEALYALHHLETSTAAGVCRHCGGAEERAHWTCPHLRIRDRVTVRCPRCGPTLHIPHEMRLDIATPDWLVPRSPAIIQICDVGSRDSETAGLAVVQLRPRARVAALDTLMLSLRPGERHDVRLDVPQELEPDLHRVRVLYLHRFGVCIAQVRVPSRPAQNG